MVATTVCNRCGEAIPLDDAECPYCAGSKPYPLLHREPVLIAAIIGVAIGLWLVAHGLTQAYGHREDHLARYWYHAGDVALRANNYEAAITDLQTAVVYSHQTPEVRLRLAEALGAAGRVRQAQSYLRALWDEQPGDATINIQLARLSARTGDLAGAERYYNGAIYGVWATDPVQNRRDARLELVRFLLVHDRFQQAQSQLIAVAADAPDDPELLVQLGRMFLQAGDAGRALQEYRLAAKGQPRNAAAFAGAGEAAFQQADYSNARRYFDRAVALDPADNRSAELLHISELVLQLDPYAARIGRDERNRRVVADFGRTLSRLEQCAATKFVDLAASPPIGPIATDYQQLTSIKSRITARVLAQNPDLLDRAMELVFRSQIDAAKICGQPAADDYAILLIGRANGVAR